MKDALIADLKAVHTAQGKISRKLYRVHGTYSENQLRKHFGSFGAAVREVFGEPQMVPAPDGSRVLVAEERTTTCSKIFEAPYGQTETNEFVGDSWNINIPNTQIQTLEELIAHCKVDTKVWTVTRFLIIKKDCVQRGQITDQSFQITASFLRNKNTINAKAEIDSLIADAKLRAPWPKHVVRSSVESGNMLELMCPDLHAGKLSWGRETGYKDYDTAIAVATYQTAIDELLDRAKGYKFDLIVLGVGNDLLHTDTIQGTTYSGTKVDTDTRFHKTYRIVRQMIVDAIEKLRLIAPVLVKIVPGNHDTLSTFTLGDSLECRFHNYTDVEIDNSPSLHKTVEWGKVFLMLTHGHLGKQDDYGMWMASEYPEQFGRTKFREVHVGHTHKSALNEKFGVRVRTLSALTAADAWHAQNGFIGNLRVAEGLVWNKEKGLIAQFYYTEVN